MRSAIVLALLGMFSTPLIGFAQSHGAACPCGHVAPTPAVVVASAPVVQSGCSSCNACGSSNGCGSGLCSNWPEFYNRLYSDFYYNNQWYFIHKQKEAAARRARMYGMDTPPAKPTPSAPLAPVKK